MDEQRVLSVPHLDAQSRDLVTGKRVLRLNMASPYEACPASNVPLEHSPAIATNV